MDYTSRTRDRFRWAATGVSGLLTTGFLIGTGALAGQIAADQQAADAARQRHQAEQYAAWQAEQTHVQARGNTRPRIVTRERPARVRVTTRYVTAPARSVSVSPATSYAGTHTSSGSHTTASSHGSGGGSAPVHHTSPPPPPPASSGS